MTITASTRLGVTLWSSGADAFNRSQLQATHQALEAKVVGYQQGTSRPVAGAALEGFLYQDTASGVLSYCDGATWFDVNNYGAVVGLTVGGAGADGSNATASRSDHVHSLPAWGSALAIDGTNTNGVLTTFARSDHKHGIADGSITAVMFAPGAVASSGLGVDAVATTNIQDGAVTNAKLGLSSVLSTTISAGAVTNAALAASGLDISKFTVGTSNRDTTGNAATATSTDTITTGRTIALSGDASGTSAAFDGSANVTIPVTVADNSHSHTSSTISGLSAADLTSGTFTISLNTSSYIQCGSTGKYRFGGSTTYIDYNNDSAGEMTFKKSTGVMAYMGTKGVKYPSVSGISTNAHYMAFGWGGGNLLVYVDDIYVGAITPA